MQGFTIVELLIVIVVIAILAAIVIVSYNGIVSTSKETILKTDLRSGANQLVTYKTINGNFPTDTAELRKGNTTDFSYSYNDFTGEYCLAASSPQVQNKSYFIDQRGSIETGVCPAAVAQPGSSMQAVTATTCPPNRTVVVDTRDGRSYWVQKLADDKCWMLTNLAYAGGGNNANGDVKTITNASSFGTASYTAAYYMVGPEANPTVYPTEPRVSTDGGATNPQYGYFYNWCAALGVQTSTAACSNASSPLPNASISICPSGWRLPTGGPGGEIAALTTAIGAVNSTTGANIARSTLLYQLSGSFRLAHSPQSFGYWWTSSQQASSQGYMLSVGASTVNSSGTGSKDTGFAVRCVAS